MTDRDDRRLYLLAPLPAQVNRFISLSEDLAPAWRAAVPVQTARRHLVLLDLSAAGEAVGQTIRHACRFVTDALPEAFRVNVNELEVTHERAVLMPSEPVREARRVQMDLLAAAGRGGLTLPLAAAPRPYVALGHGYAQEMPATRIDGIGWQVGELRLVLSHGAIGVHEVIDSWALPDRRMLAA